MKNDNYEIELKFKIDDDEKIRKLLKDKKAEFIGKAFERTIRFDTEDKKLEKEGKFIRTRTGFKDVITFKKKVESKEFKEREEIELEISDIERMNMILRNIGFSKSLIMEKYREKWNLNNTEIVIDELPMGKFVEIEGDKDSIKEVAEYLMLDLNQKITVTYWEIWKDFSKENNIDDENIIFHK